MKATPSVKFLVTRQTGFFCSEDGGKPWDGREITSIRDWTVNAHSHAEAIALAGGPDIAPGESAHEFRTPDTDERSGVFEAWEAATFKELARREGDPADARELMAEASRHPGRELTVSPERDSVERDLAAHRAGSDDGAGGLP